MPVPAQATTPLPPPATVPGQHTAMMRRMWVLVLLLAGGSDWPGPLDCVLLNWLSDGGDTSCLLPGQSVPTSQTTQPGQTKYFSPSDLPHCRAEGPLPWAGQAAGGHQQTEGERAPAAQSNILHWKPGRPLQCWLRSDWLQLLAGQSDRATTPLSDFSTNLRKILNYLSIPPPHSATFIFHLDSLLFSDELCVINQTSFWPQLIGKSVTWSNAF